MLEARKGHTLSALPDGSLIVIGGRDPAGTLLASVERLPPRAKSWEAIGRLQVARADHTASVLGDHILVVGGAGMNGDTSEGPLSTSERFGLTSGRATPGPPLRAARSHHQALATETGDLWVIGGGGLPNPGDTEVLLSNSPRFEFGPQREGVNLDAAWLAGNDVVLVESHRGRTLAPIPKFSRFLNAGRTQEPPLFERLNASIASPIAQALPPTASLAGTQGPDGVMVLAQVSDQWRAWRFDRSTHQLTPVAAPPQDAAGSLLMTGPGKQPMVVGEVAAARFDGARWLPFSPPPADLFGYAITSTSSSLVLTGGSDRSRADRGVTDRAFRLAFSELSKPDP